MTTKWENVFYDVGNTNHQYVGTTFLQQHLKNLGIWEYSTCSNNISLSVPNCMNSMSSAERTPPTSASFACAACLICCRITVSNSVAPSCPSGQLIPAMMLWKSESVIWILGLKSCRHQAQPPNQTPLSFQYKPKIKFPRAEFKSCQGNSKEKSLARPRCGYWPTSSWPCRTLCCRARPSCLCP